jgi:hypothetical protein
MDHIRVFELIDKQIEALDDIKRRNTVLIPGVLASVATLKQLKLRMEEEIEGRQVQEPEDAGF